MLVRASMDDDGITDLDGDGDIDADDWESWEQLRIHSDFEHLNEIPWWAVEDEDNDASGGQTRMLETMDQAHPVDEQQLVQDLSEIAAQKSKKNRRTQTTPPASVVTNGYCLPPQRALFTGRSICQRRTQRCGGRSGACCAGLACIKSNGSHRCRTTCSGPNKDCSTGTTCCSQQCVLCQSGCQGRCGLGIELPKDNIQVRKLLHCLLVT
jgi:hypothetical protein